MKRNSVLTGLLLAAAAMTFTTARAASQDANSPSRSLTAIKTISLPGGRVEADLKLSGAAPKPLAFSVNQPAMIVLDLPKTALPQGKPAFIAGVAFAGNRGIRKVEVSLDGGRTWQNAKLKSALSPYSWVLWAYPWADPRPGTYQVTARATDGSGALQQSRPAPSFPKGAAGLDRIEVTVK